jgi:hypothetical protein
MHATPERRSASRFETMMRVLLATEEHGELWCIARNVSESGMFVEMPEPYPLGTKVVVRFQRPEGRAAICAMARIQNHYYLQFGHQGTVRGLTGVGIRFLRFVPEVGMPAPDELIH